METTWKTALHSGQAFTNNDDAINPTDLNNPTQPRIYPLLHLGSLTITGKDAVKLLQGQLTCNVNEISPSKGNITALCNPKGRVIATFLLVKRADAFVLILPSSMLEIVQKRLQMFVLRSDVKIVDTTDSLCLLGVCEPGETTSTFSTESHQDIIFINLPGFHSRKIFLAETDIGLDFWSRLTDSQNNQNAYQKASVAEWRSLDIVSGIPWVTTSTSEEFIPQMLNLDKLGGVSFNKGCYTGQEIVARTHYLGKAKRELFLAESKMTTPPEPNSNIVKMSGTEQEVIGKVLQSQMTQEGCVMQVVLKRHETDDLELEGQNLVLQLSLQDDALTPIKLIPFPT